MSANCRQKLFLFAGLHAIAPVNVVVTLLRPFYPKTLDFYGMIYYDNISKQRIAIVTWQRVDSFRNAPQQTVTKQQTI